jgi:hypothetical protein
MLRISTHEDDQTVRLRLEGALAGSWVRELELTWRTVRATLRDRLLWVDLTGTTRVDAAGHYLLELMHKHGVQFLAAGPAMQALISEITGELKQDRNS